MKIQFATRSMQRRCSSEKEMRKAWGEPMARKLQQRLAELEAAVTLADVSRLPPARCHELTGDRRGELSADLVHPYRLLFKPDHDPMPCKPDGGLDWSRVTQIVILEIADTH